MVYSNAFHFWLQHPIFEALNSRDDELRFDPEREVSFQQQPDDDFGAEPADMSFGDGNGKQNNHYRATVTQRQMKLIICNKYYHHLKRLGIYF